MSEKPSRWITYSVAALLALLLLVGIGVNVKWLYDRRAFLEREDAYGDLFSDGPTKPLFVRWIGDDGAYRIVVRRKADVARAQRLFPEANVLAAERITGVPSGVRAPQAYLGWLNRGTKRSSSSR